MHDSDDFEVGMEPRCVQTCDDAHLTGRKLGAKGEDAACRYLSHKDYLILDRNWRCQFGEVDIVAMDGDDLVFVEVKTRSGYASGFPEEAVTSEKRRRYEGIALAYLAEHPSIRSVSLRFDVMSITMVGNHRAVLRHHQDAFGRGD